MVKRYLFSFMFFLTLSGCADVLLDTYEENFQTSVTLWGVEYSIKNTIELANTNLHLKIDDEKISN